MAQTGFTVIQPYYTTTASGVPLLANLAIGEIALNLADRRMFTRDATPAVVELGTNPSSVTTSSILTSLGSAASPSRSFVGDTNTGDFSPMADVYGISTAGVERLRVDASGNLGVGRTTDGTARVQTAGGNVDFSNSGDIRATVTSSGFGSFGFGLNNSGATNTFGAPSSFSYLGTTLLTGLVFTNGATERMRLTINGNLLIGSTIEPPGAGGLSVAGNVTLGDATTDTLNVGNGGLIKDAAGRVGINYMPSPWLAGVSVIDFTVASVYNREVAVGNRQAAFSNNVYVDSAGIDRYKLSDFSTRYLSTGGVQSWSIAPSGTAGNPITFTQAMTLDAAGNLGVGVTPSAWGASKRAIQIGADAALYFNSANDSSFSVNSYNNGTNNIYLSNNFATNYRQNVGNHQWFTAPSGTAGNPITFTQAMTLTQGGNLLVGTTSDNGDRAVSTISSNTLYNFAAVNDGAGATYFNARTSAGVSQFRLNRNGADGSVELASVQAGASLTFGTVNTERARISAAGSLLIGKTTGSARIEVRGDNSTTGIYFENGATPITFLGVASGFSGAFAPTDGVLATYNGNLLFANVGGERARITAGGYFKASNTGTYSGAGIPDQSVASNNIFQSNANNTVIATINTSTGATVQSFSSNLPTGAAGFHYNANINGAVVYQVLANGNAQNTNNSYGAISDIKLKENVVDASPKLANLNRLRVVNYNLIGSGLKQIGLIAQEVEQVFPGLVEETIDTAPVEKTRTVEVPAVLDEDGNETAPATTREETYTENEPTGTVTKAVKYSVLVPMMLKAVQELCAEVATLKAQVAANGAAA